MTREQLDDANRLVARIKRLQEILIMFKTDAASFDESLTRMTSFNLLINKSSGHIEKNINQGEILFLIEALKNEIAMLEGELAKI